jgi:ppGpp synthetase/RelA/SpoT-type nucleotidyltranferase
MREELRRRYLERSDLLEDLRTALERETRDALRGISNIDRVTFRVKGVDSFLEKALDPRNVPSYTDPFVEIEDQVAGRVIVFFRRDLASVHERLERTFSTVERSSRRPARDEEFGYESDHLICLIPPQLKPPGWDGRLDIPSTFELQIRTVFMHAYAEPQHDIGYKGAEELPRDIRRELAWIAASAWGADQAYERVSVWSTRRDRAGG